MTEQELLELKKEVEEAKANHSKLEGRKETLMEQLQKEFGVSSIAEAEEKIKLMEDEVADWDEKILEATNALEDKLDGKDTATEEPTRAGQGEKAPTPKRDRQPTRRTPRQ